MMKNLKKILLVFITLVISCSVTISAEKLSKKIIGNTEFYCYKVKTKETIFGIAKKFNVTQDELAEKLYISRATVNKLIKNLRDAGYVLFDANHVGRYVLADKSIVVVETFKQLEQKK